MSKFMVIEPIQGFIPEGKTLICQIHDCEFLAKKGRIKFCLQLTVLRPKKYKNLILQQVVPLVHDKVEVFVTHVLNVFLRLGVDVDRFDDEHLADEFYNAASCIAKDRDVVEVVMGRYESFNIVEKLL